MEFYQMVAGESPDIVEPGENIMALKPVCLTSAFQLMDRKPISVEIVPPERTVIFPDFILYLNPLNSVKKRQYLSNIMPQIVPTTSR